MPHHVMVALPGDRLACADYREPVVKIMRRINRATAEGDPPAQRDLDEVSAWLDDHAVASAMHIRNRFGCVHEYK